ncbi:hypothetical protein KIN20_021178 [Parelaphostrongylus tenuis]|uniref:Uncharacterized protein n=1 Tax=Parelaphostrongylus tenuis TaxID=148309 RepID=A0AAD5QRD9_PARTN|nr:hypothetical protein KIN20_021178 [Parelaphostrongylus tenuis]
MHHTVALQESKGGFFVSDPPSNISILLLLFSMLKNDVGRAIPQEWVYGGVCTETGVDVYAAADQSLNDVDFDLYVHRARIKTSDSSTT